MSAEHYTPLDFAITPHKTRFCEDGADLQTFIRARMADNAIYEVNRLIWVYECYLAEFDGWCGDWGEWKCVYDRDFDDPDWRGCDIAQNKTPNGQWLNIKGGTGFHGERVIRVDRVGKAAAGDCLASEQHHAWPEVK